MPRKANRLTVALILFVLLISLAACGSGNNPKESSGNEGAQPATGQEPAKAIHLVLWTASGALVGGAEAKLPQDQWVLSKMLRKFEELNPGVTVEAMLIPDQGQAHQTFKAAALAKNGPDLVNLWTGLYTTSLKDAAYNLDGKVPQEDLDNLIGWDTVREDLKPDGSILAYPWGATDAIGIGYSKKLIKAAGLDFEANPPKTTAELDAAFEKIKATNVIPLVSDEGSWPANLYYIVNYWWQQLSGGESIMKQNKGETKFADDAGLKAALTYYQSLYKNGYVNKDALSSTNAAERFMTGEAAMRYVGIGSIPTLIAKMGDDLGVIPTPDMPGAKVTGSQIGGVGQALVVAKYSKNPEMAIKLAGFLNSPEFYTEYVKVNPIVPIRKDFTFDNSGMEALPILQQLFGMAQKSILFTDNMVDSDAMNELAKQAPLIYTGKQSPEEVLKAMDKQIANKLK